MAVDVSFFSNTNPKRQLVRRKGEENGTLNGEMGKAGEGDRDGK